jgi:hypothetical protein
MAKSLITPYFKVHLGQQFIESISESANSAYYVFAGRSFPYDNGDSVEDLYSTHVDYEIDPYDQMIFGKRISPSDVIPVIKRYDWTPNTVFQSYRHDLVLTNTNFYTVVNAVSEYYVFKVLDNNGDAPSTVAPQKSETSADDEYYSTSDGYVWKYMYTIPKDMFVKFATNAYVPVIPDANVSGNAISGSIDFIDVPYGGSFYNTYTNGNFGLADLRVDGNKLVYGIDSTANPSNNFYEDCYLVIVSGTGQGQYREIVNYQINPSTNKKLVTILEPFSTDPDITSYYEISPIVRVRGDGSGCQARALISDTQSNSIIGVEVLNRGSGYSFADASIDSIRSAYPSTKASDIANIKPIISPLGGHGFDPAAELIADSIGISVTFANNEGATIPTDNDYRSIGILKDPVFANVQLNFTTYNGFFNEGETVQQEYTLATGRVYSTVDGSSVDLTNVVGTFVASANIVGLTTNASATVDSIEINGAAKGFDTFDQRKKFTYNDKSTTNFTADEVLFQEDINISNAIFHSIDNNYIYMTNVRGNVNTGVRIVGNTSGAFATLLSTYPEDLIHGSGQVLYIENREKIQRSNSQSETIKLILSF